jgi:hypothetical protein
MIIKPTILDCYGNITHKRVDQQKSAIRRAIVTAVRSQKALSVVSFQDTVVQRSESSPDASGDELEVPQASPR